ncbi:MAG: pyruvate formate-lyase-activating protein [Schaedlerella sp.]|nr:pyruvate formate-lyase-activating protein [Schaedlerella sp.]
MEGYIHSIESFGTVDGPGIRFVVFTQGCPMRCKYCHNPDTWEMKKGTKMSSDELIRQFLKNRYFYKNGGITVTGGEPLLQINFLLELFQKAKEHGIHTCIDTSGVTYYPGNIGYNEKLDQLMQYTDLVMLDIKHIDPVEHKDLTKQENKNILAFAKYLEEKKVPVWIRHVVVPGITDQEVYLRKLGEFIRTLSNVKALDVLPYHVMGVGKYKELGMEYPLEGIEAATGEDVKRAKKIILEGYRKKSAV